MGGQLSLADSRLGFMVWMESWMVLKVIIQVHIQLGGTILVILQTVRNTIMDLHSLRKKKKNIYGIMGDNISTK